MAEVEAMSAGLLSIEGYPNRSNKQPWIMLAMIVGTDVFLDPQFDVVHAGGTKPADRPSFLFWMHGRFQLLQHQGPILPNSGPGQGGTGRAPFHLPDGKGGGTYGAGSRASTRTSVEGPAWPSWSSWTGSVPVAIPAEVVGTLVPLLEKDEEMAEERSTPQGLDPSDPEFKRALRGKNNARKLMILMGVSFPFIVALALVTVFWS